jgi:arginase family enzyme
MAQLRVNIYQRSDIDKHTVLRDGETKVGQTIKLLQNSSTSSLGENLLIAQDTGARYAIILVAEDIGPRANLGRAGAEEAPQAFLSFFLNMQANQFFDCSRVLIVGEVDVADLMQKSRDKEGESIDYLRKLCAQLDERIAPIIREITAAGLEPIVIGGGNNNSFPTIQGVVQALRRADANAGSALSVANCDPHADFRRLEGRHSGNPFSYAHEKGYLRRYYVFGLHEDYNSDEMLRRLDERGFVTFAYEDFAVRRSATFEDSLEKLLQNLTADGLPVGCELDLDSIENMPSSAETPFGISNAQAAHFIHSVASRTNTAYLHISEGAPKLSHGDGFRKVGKSLALQVMTYVKARELFRRTVSYS